MPTRSRKNLGISVVGLSIALLLFGMTLEDPAGKILIALSALGSITAIVLLARAPADAG